MPCKIIPIPQQLRPSLPTIVGNVDYLTLRKDLEEMDGLLIGAGAETDFVQRALDRWIQAGEAQPTANEQEKFQERSRRALRCNVLRTFLQLDYRGFSCELAGNPLYQWFCGIDALDRVRVPSKSELHRFANWLPADTMPEVIQGVLKAAMERPGQLRLKEALDLEEYFLDSTCVKANIHFPTDWVLLRDGVRTLMKATLVIRKAGLRGRMEAPEEFLRRMNRLSIQMTQTKRRKGAKKERKRVLRQMKKLVGTVRDHAKRHRDLLDERWEQTEWTRPQAEVVLRRMDSVLELLPRALKQAHERIIGQRQVPNGEKILSLYEEDAHVIVRGKAGAEVEFGNSVIIGENRQGVILDYKMFQESAPADSKNLTGSVNRVFEWSGRKVGAAAGDRGFASKSNSKALEESGIFDAICPRSPSKLKEKMKDKKFARMQGRRGQTEGRIGILKNGFLGRPMRAKGFANRELGLAWGVLTHNLWKLSRITKKAPKKKQATLVNRAA